MKYLLKTKKLSPIAISVSLLLWLNPSMLFGQFSAYDQQLQDNIKVLDHYEGYLSSIARYSNLDPLDNTDYTVEKVFRAAAELEFMFADDIESKYEQRYKDEYEMIADSVRDAYSTIDTYLKQWDEQLRKDSRSSDAEYPKSRIKQFVEWNILALAFAVYEPPSPFYDDIYPRVNRMYEAYVGGPGGRQDLAEMRRPEVKSKEIKADIVDNRTAGDIARAKALAEQKAAAKKREADKQAREAEIERQRKEELERVMAEVEAEKERIRKMIEEAQKAAQG
jgi:hypothetical protein